MALFLINFVNFYDYLSPNAKVEHKEVEKLIIVKLKIYFSVGKMITIFFTIFEYQDKKYNMAAHDISFSAVWRAGKIYFYFCSINFGL